MEGNSSIVLENSTEMDETARDNVLVRYAMWRSGTGVYHRGSECGGDCMSCRSCSSSCSSDGGP